MRLVTAPRLLQVWKDALSSKQQSPYITHTLAGGTLRAFHFCPFEVGHMPYVNGPAAGVPTGAWSTAPSFRPAIQ